MVNNLFLSLMGGMGMMGGMGQIFCFIPLSEFIYCAHSYVTSRFVCPCYLFYLAACSV